MTSAEFWHGLPPFDYIVTYSFNRGPKLQRLQQAAADLQEATEQELLTARFVQQRALRQRLEALAQVGQRQGVPLTTAEGCFDITASPVARFNRTDQVTRLLHHTLMGPTAFSLVAGCRPTFRDALVFHDQQAQIVRVLNICFQCRSLQGEAGEFIEADTSVYDQLSTLLTALGHPIETSHVHQPPYKQKAPPAAAGGVFLGE